MRVAFASLVASIAVSVWICHAISAHGDTLPSYPISLTLKEKGMTAVDPTKAVPDILYKKQRETRLEQVRWIVVLEVIEDGKQTTQTITWEGGNYLIPVTSENGVITGKAGNWQTGVSSYLLLASARGEGTMRFALFDPAKFDQTLSVEKGAGQVSNWLAIPVRLKKN